MGEESNNAKRPAAISRRRFLKMSATAPLAGLGAPPALALFAAILEGQGQKAWADSLGYNPRTLINLTASGGPARWTYNNFLNPYSSPEFNPHPMVASEFIKVGDRYVGTQYVSYEMKGIKVPTFWTHTVPAPGGGYRPVADLLDNLLCIQGINTRNAGHGGAQLAAFTPPGAKQSASALSADASDAPFAAVNLGAASFNFRSIASKSAITTSAAGGISGLLSTFQPITNAAKYLADKAIFDAALNSVLPSLDAIAKSGHLGAQAIIENRQSAMKLTETNFSALAAVWTALVGKYKDLISRAIYDPNNTLAGINDLPIGEGGTGAAALYELDMGNPAGLNLIPDFRSVVGPLSTINGMAENYALTEYIVINKLSSSVSFDMSGITKLVDPMGTARLSMSNDSHTSGIYPHTYISTLRHRASAACLLELITQLKAADRFNDVVIREAGEFNRVPRADLAGSDHGASGLSQSFYCGAFNGPLIVGNLAKTNKPNNWGSGGMIPELGRQLYLTDAVVTLAHLLRVPPPLTSTHPVVTLSSSGLVSNIGTTRYV